MFESPRRHHLSKDPSDGKKAGAEREAFSLGDTVGPGWVCFQQEAGPISLKEASPGQVGVIFFPWAESPCVGVLTDFSRSIDEKLGSRQGVTSPHEAEPRCSGCAYPQIFLNIELSGTPFY